MTNEEIAKEAARQITIIALADPCETLWDRLTPIILAAINRAQSEDTKRLADLLEQMVNVAENADETGYVTDCGFVDLDKLHTEVREAIDELRRNLS